ncbi:DUF4232 domain-containing protein [Streptomyces sp. NBC_01497]|uniref:DUF4232 domain-containing protein n=1 Tax=Streptomyces sp. NBC_01497 TaxID=2903885 RepID=UPI002E310797|nr:DUF4232 domain-containing protein [Streptomyces sp. NBC_01497]
MAENLRRRRTAAVLGAGRHRARVGAVALVAASGLALAGCGSGSPSAPRSVSGSAGPATDSASSSPSASGATGASTSAPADGATSPSARRSTSSGPHTTQPGGRSTAGGDASATAGVGRCHTSDLKASVGPDDPGAGQENHALVLTNTSGRTCTVQGFPGFAFVDGAGKRVAPDPARAGARKAAVRLAPGHSAWAALGFPNPGIVGGATVTPAAVEITPPDEKAFLKVAWSGGPVSKSPPPAAASHVGPFQPGTGPAR